MNSLSEINQMSDNEKIDKILELQGIIEAQIKVIGDRDMTIINIRKTLSKIMKLSNGKLEHIDNSKELINLGANLQYSKRGQK